MSGTNVQEVGVDEPDRVKANAEAIYVTGRGPGWRCGADRRRARPRGTTLDIDGLGYGSELLLDRTCCWCCHAATATSTRPRPRHEGTAFAPEPYYPEPTTILTRFDLS